MLYRIDERTGNKLSALGFGCMRFPRSFEATESIVLKAIEQGINYFDTAYIYGSSEETLGKILKKHSLRNKVYIATKLPLLICKSASDFEQFFCKQLDRLQTDYIDYYLLHMLSDMSLWKKLCDWGIKDWLKEKVASGKIKQVGFSFHGRRDDFLNLLEEYDWDFCQIQYNYINENYQAGITGLKKAASKGIPVIVMEPLLGGKLANGLPKEAVDIFKKENPSLTPAGWALKWLWNQPEVTVILSGMNSDKQLTENIQSAEKSLPNIITAQEEEAFTKVIKVFNTSYKIPCTGCNYCMPCPKNVNIPACFAAYNTTFSLGFIAGMQQYITGTGAASDTQSSAGLCTKCGKCEKQCPQNIKIRNSLDAVRSKMEPLWYRCGLSVARAFLGKNNKNNKNKKR